MSHELLLGLICAESAVLAVLCFGLRVILAVKTSEAFEVGVKVGRGVASMGQPWVDEQLRSAGLDPEKLKGRS